MYDFIEQAIKRDKPHEAIEKAVMDYRYQMKLYTGLNQGDIITDYRIRESDNQKNQRKRITISRTKHIIKQIENIYGYLEMMDSPIVSILTENDNIKSDVEKWVYDNDLKTLAFRYVSLYGGLLDANAWAICTVNNLFEELEFKIATSENLYDIIEVNGNIKGVLFRYKRKTKDKEVHDYTYYSKEKVIEYKNREGIQLQGNEVFRDGYIVTETPSNMMLCFNLGFNPDTVSAKPTKVTNIEPASELFKSLIWQGSEMDTVKATHGIIQKFAYARKCNYRNRTEEHSYQCSGGYLVIDGKQTSEKCSKCNGTGLDIHTSSQDIITYPLPDDPANALRLSDMVFTLSAPTDAMTFNREDIENTKEEILRTVFNSSVITKDEITATATEKVIDLQGVYATLNQLGKHISNLFIWMVECYCEWKGYTGVNVVHGYTLDLKLESIETLSEKRKKLIDANAPIEVIKALDLAILKKQHMDAPAYVNRFIVWEQYRPFSDKNQDEIQNILTGLPTSNYYKVLYNFWGHIKREIENVHGDAFFSYNDQKRKELIIFEVQKIQETLKSEEPQRISLTGLDIDG